MTLRRLFGAGAAACLLTFITAGVAGPSEASVGMCSPDNHACATWYGKPRTWDLKDNACDGDYVYLTYWSDSDSVAPIRVENHNGCYDVMTVYAQIPSDATYVSWKVCHNRNNWPDNCSSVVTSYFS